jgi:hypothetical protein
VVNSDRYWNLVLGSGGTDEPAGGKERASRAEQDARDALVRGEAWCRRVTGTSGDLSNTLARRPDRSVLGFDQGNIRAATIAAYRRRRVLVVVRLALYGAAWWALMLLAGYAS